MILTSANVSKVFLDCLFEDLPKLGDQYIPVRSVTKNFGFRPEKVEEHKDEIIEFLDCLDEKFKEEVGGGYSFLSACIDKNGFQWGEHRNIEELISLGMAAGLVEFCLPRELWSCLPGGVPYFMILKDPKEIKLEVYYG